MQKYNHLDINMFLYSIVSRDAPEDIVLEKIESVMFWKESENNAIYENVMNEFGNLAKEIHEGRVEREDIEKRITIILEHQIKNERDKSISLKSEINNYRIKLINEYLDANRFFELNENYLPAEKVLNDSPALNWYNVIHKKEQGKRMLDKNDEKGATC